MAGLRFADLTKNPVDVLDFTSLTLDEFQLLVGPFETAFRAHMAAWQLDGHPRTARTYTTYRTCPLPTPEDRLLFILSYLKSNPLQVFHGRLFGIRQNKANQWIHTLRPVLRATLATLGDLPRRDLDDLACRLGMAPAQVQEPVAAAIPATDPVNPNADPTDHAPVPPPLFAMMAPNDPFHVPRMRQNRNVARAARRSATR